MPATFVEFAAAEREAPRQPVGAVKSAGRVVALDAYRGLVMFLMMAEVLRLSRVAQAFPNSVFWRVLAFNQTHVEWFGCSLHDLIQPSFSFLVGVALPYSLASRIAKGKSFGALLGHAAWRSLLLIALGIFLRSMSSTQTNFTFEDTLTQIGLGYTFLFLLAWRTERAQWLWLGAILFGYWLAWALYPVGPGAGVPADWPHNFTGFAAHWNKNSNLGQVVARLGSRDSDAAFSGSGRDGNRSGPAASFHGNRACCEAHLDARLDDLQRRRMFPAPRWLLLVNRNKGMEAVDLLADGHWDEFDRRLSDGPSVRAVPDRFAADQSGPRRLPPFRRRTRAVHHRRGRSTPLLADVVVDVPPKTISQNLTSLA